MDVMDYLMENYEWEAGQNYIRFEKMIDIMSKFKSYKFHKGKRKTGLTVHVIPEKVYYYAKNQEELADIVINHLEFHMDKRKKVSMVGGNRPNSVDRGGYDKHHHNYFGTEYGLKKGQTMEDTDLMPWGKHKGEPMGKIPADYFIWLLENEKCSGSVKAYIQENESILRMQMANKKKGIR